MDDRDELVEELLRAQRRLLRASLSERLEPLLNSPLTLQQLKLLLLVHFHGEQNMRDLAGILNVSLPTISGAVDRLVERGLLTRREEPSDRRIRLVAISADGERQVNEIEEAGSRFGRDLLEVLDTDTLRHYARAHVQLAEALERRICDGETPGSPGT